MKCEYCNETNKVFMSKFGKYLCRRHYGQYKVYGHPILSSKKKELNRYIEQDSFVLMQILDRYSCIKAETKIDKEDYERVKELSWFFTETGYIRSNEGGYLHRFILNVSNEFEVDHVDRDKTNNLKNNLRLCTSKDNSRNTKRTLNKHSGIVKTNNRWRARIFVDGKSIHLGYFDTKGEAIAVRKKAEEKYFGEFKPKKRTWITKET